MIGPTKKNDVLELVQKERELLGAARASQLRNRSASSQPMGEAGGWALHLVDLGAPSFIGGTRADSAAYAVIDVAGYGVQVLQGGSDRIPASLEAAGAGSYGPVYPGWSFRSKRRFTRLRLRAWESSGQPAASSLTIAGSFCWGRWLSIAVALEPDAELLEPGGDVGAGFDSYRYSTLQAYNSTANVPTSALDGISVRGARSVRVGIQSNPVGSTTITAGTIVWWHNPWSRGTAAGATLWGETEVQQVLVGGRNICWCPEMEVVDKDGALFPEVRSYTASAANAPTVIMKVFGTGGELTGAAGLL